jgi:hypothetical protein
MSGNPLRDLDGAARIHVLGDTRRTEAVTTNSFQPPACPRIVQSFTPNIVQIDIKFLATTATPRFFSKTTCQLHPRPGLTLFDGVVGPVDSSGSLTSQMETSAGDHPPSTTRKCNNLFRSERQGTGLSSLEFLKHN